MSGTYLKIIGTQSTLFKVGAVTLDFSGASATTLTLLNFGASMQDKASFTEGTSNFNPGGGVYNDELSAISSGTSASTRITAYRANHVNIRDNSGNEITSWAVTQSGTWNIGTVTTITNTVGVAGNVAHDSADSGNPVKVGGQAITSERTAVANGDRSDFVTDVTGKQIILPYSNPENFISGSTSSITSTSNTSVIAAQGSGVRIYVTQLLVTNSHATVSTFVNIKDGTTTIYTGFALANGGGFSVTLLTPLKLTANTALNAACETTGSSVRVSACGYKGA